MEKREARRKITKRIAALGAGKRVRSSNAVVKTVLGLREFQEARCVLLFVPMADEVDVRGLIEAALRMGKCVGVPTCSTRDRRLIPAEIRDLAELAPGAYGILEPKTLRPIAVDEIDFVLVPAAGFDAAGNRLGRGAGYYDRFMSRSDFRAVKCGVAFDVQVQEEIPHDERDLPVDILVTEKRLRRFSRIPRR